MQSLVISNGQNAVQASTTLALSDYLHPFLTQLDSEKSRTDYRNDLRLFVEWVHKPVQEVTPLDILAYRRSMEERGLKSATIHKRLSVLRSFFLFLHQTFNLQNPALCVKLPKITDQSSKAVLSLQEVGKLLSVLDTSSLLGKRDRAILGLLLVNGLRTIEVSRADVGDIHDVDGIHVLKVKGKGNKIADAKLRQDVYEAIMDYVEARGGAEPEEPLFLSIGNLARGRISPKTIQTRVRGYFAEAGISKSQLSPHSLRHTCATLTLSIGNADLLQVQQLMRHSSPTVTHRYLASISFLKNNAVDRNPISL